MMLIATAAMVKKTKKKLLARLIDYKHRDER